MIIFSICLNKILDKSKNYLTLNKIIFFSRNLFIFKPTAINTFKE